MFCIMLTYIIVITVISMIFMVVCAKIENIAAMTLLHGWILLLMPITTTFVFILITTHVIKV